MKLNLLLLFLIVQWQLLPAQSNTWHISADLRQTNGEMKPIWAFFGYDEPNYTYGKDGSKLLTELAGLSPVPVYVRTHNLLTSGDGQPALKWGSTNAYTEDAQGRSIYSWKIVDSIFDSFVHRGMKPIAEIGFMPEALSTQPVPYRHEWTPAAPYKKIFTGWAYPPKDYEKWSALIYEWVKHCVERYGKQEVASWWWEVWNEPDIGYWQGTPEEYFKLYDFAADALKRACSQARIGGPTSTSPRSRRAYDFLVAFLKHCATGVNYKTGATGAPLDYISFHAKGSPSVMNGFVRMNMAVQLTDINKGFEAVAASPFKQLPVMIGECDPEGCAACSMQYNPQNAYRNGTMYSSYTAASYARIYDLAKIWGIHLEGAVSWSFEFEDQPWFAGFRDLATNGVDKPVLNLFRMFGKMGGQLIKVENDRALTLEQLSTKGVHDGTGDVQALISADRHSASVLLWNYYDDDLPGPDATVELKLGSIPAGRLKIEHYRIDSLHSNAYTVWKKAGSPQQVSGKQYKLLEQAGRLQLLSPPFEAAVKKGVCSYTVRLPRQAVSLLRISW